MRIAFVSDVAYPWVKGGKEAIEWRCMRMLAKRHKVYCFSMQWNGMKRRFRHWGIAYDAYPKADQKKLYAHGRRSIAYALKFAIWLPRLFAYRFDVLIANDFPYLHMPFIKFYCRLTNCRLIADVAEFWEKDYWKSYLKSNVLGSLAFAYAKHALKDADAYIANSSTTASILNENGIGKNSTYIFKNVLDKRLIKSVRHGKRKKRVIFSGRLIKEKRIDIFIKSFIALNKKVPDATALIIGDGPELPKLKRLAKESKNISFIPFIKEKRELYKLIAESSLFFMPSEREGLSIITLESLALGTPVLLPRNSPIPPEIKKMCIVTDDIEGAMEKVLNSKNPKAFVKKGIDDFYDSGALNFYEGIFNAIDGIEKHN